MNTIDPNVLNNSSVQNTQRNEQENKVQQEQQDEENNINNPVNNTLNNTTNTVSDPYGDYNDPSNNPNTAVALDPSQQGASGTGFTGLMGVASSVLDPIQSQDTDVQHASNGRQRQRSMMTAMMASSTVQQIPQIVSNAESQQGKMTLGSVDSTGYASNVNAWQNLANTQNITAQSADLTTTQTSSTANITANTASNTTTNTAENTNANATASPSNVVSGGNGGSGGETAEEILEEEEEQELLAQQQLQWDINQQTLKQQTIDQQSSQQQVKGAGNS